MTSANAIAVSLMMVVATGAGAQTQQPLPSDDRLFEINVTRDLNLSSGEPQIAVDPNNPNRVAIVEFAMGSAEFPAFSYNSADPTNDP